MFIFDLKVGYSCNNKCAHCIIEVNKKSIQKRGEKYDRSTMECKAEIDKGHELCINSGEAMSKVVITGGEATIRKDLPELCDYIMSKGFSGIDLQTNGRALHKYEFTKLLIDNYPIRFIIALHGPHAEIHDQVTGQKSSFVQTVQGLKNIKECGGKVMGKIVISTLNYRYLRETVELYKELGVKSINIAFPHSSINDERFFQYVPRYQEVHENVKMMLENSRNSEIYVEMECMPFCFMKGFEECVSELELKQHNTLVSAVQSDTFDWQRVRLEIKAKARTCRNCLFDSLCEGVWKEYIHFYGDEEFQPVTNLKDFTFALSRIHVLDQFRKKRSS